jgi:hypothetical protein
MFKSKDKVSPPSHQEQKVSPRKLGVNLVLLGELGDLVVRIFKLTDD